MAATMESLADELLLGVMRFLSPPDLLSVQDVSRRFRVIGTDHSLWRNVDLRKCYNIDASMLKRIAKMEVVVSLSIADCYWLKAAELTLPGPRASQLEHLDIRGTAVSMKALIKVLAGAPSLKSLAYHHMWPLQVSDLDPAARSTWSRLRDLCVVMTVTCLKTDLFGLCESLQAFSILNGSCWPVCAITCKCNGPSIVSLLPCRTLRYLHVDPQASVIHHRSCGFPGRLVPGSERIGSFVHFYCPKAPVCWRLDPDTKVLGLSLGRSNSDILAACSRLQSLRCLYLNGTQTNQVQLRRLSRCTSLERLFIDFCSKVYRGALAENRIRLSPLKALAHAHPPLKYLKLLGVHSHLYTSNEVMEVLCQFQGLQSLSLPVCGLFVAEQQTVSLQQQEQQQQQQEQQQQQHQPSHSAANPNNFSSRFCKRQRVGLKSVAAEMCGTCRGGTAPSAQQGTEGGESCVYCQGILARLVSSNPEMETFELIGHADYLFGQVLNTVNKGGAPAIANCLAPMISDSNFYCLARLKGLRTLVLSGLPGLASGHCLVAICQGCPQLRRLSLASLGPSGQCKFLDGLCQALQHTPRLEDLRLEHSCIDGLHKLFTALHGCKSIVRLCIISQHGEVAPKEVCTMVGHCQKLVVLCLLTSMTLATRQSLTKELRKRFAPSRPALRMALRWPETLTELKDCLHQMPMVHHSGFINLNWVAPIVLTWRELQAAQ